MVLSNADALLSVLVADDSALRMEGTECSRFVSRVFRNQDTLAGLGIVDANGKVVCAPDASRLGLDVSDRQYVRDVLASGKPALSPFVTGHVSHQPVLVTARALVGSDGKVRGVAYAAVHQRALMAAAVDGEPGAPVYLVDAAGNVLSHLGEPAHAGMPPVVREALSVMPGPAGRPLLTNDADGVPRAYAAMAVPPHAAAGRLHVVRGLDASDIVRQQRNITLAGGAILLMVALLLALIQGAMRRLVMPRIDALVDAARHYTRGDFSARVTEHGDARDELSLLERTFNEMRAAIARHDATVHRLTERFQRVARATNDWIFDWDIATGESWANASLHRLLGSDALLGPSEGTAFRAR